MSTIHRECVVFDPVRITSTASSQSFIIDTWHERGLMQRSLFRSLPGMATSGNARVMLSSGMYVTCPLVKVGIQIGCIRALPVEFALVDDGAAPLLFGSDFMERLFDMQARGPGAHDPDAAAVTIDAPAKYAPETLGIRLVPDGETIDALQLERFLRGVRKIHNIGVIATTGMHQHDDWQGDRSSAKQRAVLDTIESDGHLWGDNSLHITWVENGSIWLSLASGSKKALSWLSQMFEKTTDARLRQTMANASSAEEEAAIKRLTRDQLAHTKNLEQERLAAKYIKETRREWQQTVLGEIDFRRKLTEQISDPSVRQVAQRQVDSAIADLVGSNFMPLVENTPTLQPDDRDPLRIQAPRRDRR